MITELRPIAKTPQYELTISKQKNRAYLKIVGFWRSPEEVSNYLSDWEKAVKELSRGFTLLTDATEMKIHPASVRKIHEGAQSLIIKEGVTKVAELQADKVAEMQLNGVSKDTRMPKRNFNNREEAEAWLDA
jgi:predicted nuclease of restriction endonuclease-like RecB superfamily